MREARAEFAVHLVQGTDEVVIVRVGEDHIRDPVRRDAERGERRRQAGRAPDTGPARSKRPIPGGARVIECGVDHDRPVADRDVDDQLRGEQMPLGGGVRAVLTARRTGVEIPLKGTLRP